MEISETAITGQRESVPDPEPKRWPGERITTVDVVVPVHNVEHALPDYIQVVRSYLRTQFPFEWTITVVDTASTDGVLAVAKELAEDDDRVRVLQLDHQGHGHALRTAWEYSDADVVVYLDVDLSPSVDALLPLVIALVNGHSDIAIGSRLRHGARFSDAHCGFTAARTDVIRPLLAQVADDRWFLHTELLLLAEHQGLRVHQVPTGWGPDVDNRGRIVSTTVGDVRGLVRVAQDAVGTGRERGLLWQLVAFGLIGLASTVATALLYALMRSWSPPLVANLVALTLVNWANTEANRRLTFAGAGVSRQRVHLQSLVVFALYYALTSGALLMLEAMVARPSRWLEVAVLLASSVIGTAVRFLLLRKWVFPAEPTL